MGKSAVTLIIPCYNGEEFLETCFSSILSQTFDKVEVIIINDGSKDKSESIILDYQEKILEKGYQFKYFYQKNQGAAAAIDFALKQVEGEYIMLYDVDDILMPDAIKAKADYLDMHQEYGMVRSNGYYITPENIHDNSKLIVTNEEEKHNEWIFDDILFERTNNWPSTFMVRTQCLFKHLQNKNIYISRYGQNMQIMLPVSYHYRSGFIDIPLMRYLVRIGSESHSKCEERNLELQNGFCENRKEIIRMLDMPEEEKIGYLNKIELYYIKRRIAFASEHQNRGLLRSEYRRLKEKGNVSIKERLYYMLGMNGCLYPFFGVVKKAYHKLYYLD